MTRTLLSVAAVAALLVAGCGDSEERAASGPAVAASPSATPYPTEVKGLATQPSVRFSPSVRRRLDAGAVAVVDFTARAGIEPQRLQLNREQTLQDVRWADWGETHATGRARVRTLVCDPNCARGRIVLVPGTVELSDVKVCGSRRFYATATLETIDPDTGEPAHPATYLRTPC